MAIRPVGIYKKVKILEYGVSKTALVTMHNFITKIVVVLFSLLLLTLAAIYISYRYAHVSELLLPAHKSAILRKVWTSADSQIGGSSTISLLGSAYILEYEFTAGSAHEYPYASTTIEFGDFENPVTPIDLSQYSRLSFLAKCEPANILEFELYTFEEGISRPGEFSTYKTSYGFFSCGDAWEHVAIDIQQLEVADWWLKKMNIALTEKAYDLKKTLGMSFGVSPQSPLDVKSHVIISELTLQGANKFTLYITGTVLLALWVICAIWAMKMYTRFLISDITEKLKKDRPLIAYQKLSIAPKKDKDRELILTFMATEYTNHNLTLETASKKLGINRNKINDILKEELGFTFSSYLNKLRLTEAARLLSEQSEISVSEIAGSVGYNSSSYFNKLFKIEYGYSPVAFRNIYLKKPELNT